VCTVVVSFVPAAPMPLLLLGARDEFTARPWQPPARHWPGSPLIGGRDEEAGGTWLAVHPQIPRVGCILNARGQPAALSGRRSRGELPLRAAAEGHATLRELFKDPGALASYDPFYLVCADLSSVLLLSWDGSQAALEDLEPAMHVLTNAGHLYPRGSEETPQLRPDPQAPEARPAPETPKASGALPDPMAKAARFGPKFAAHRPSGDTAATITSAWGRWLTLADGDGLSVTDPEAIIVRRELPDGRVWGTNSVSLVALGAHGLRYDFQPVPADPATWYSVDIESPV
jgi:Transport and Golgi organisation 2